MHMKIMALGDAGTRVDQPRDTTYSAGPAHSNRSENTTMVCPRRGSGQGVGESDAWREERGSLGSYTMMQPPRLYPDPLALALKDTRAAS